MRQIKIAMVALFLFGVGCVSHREMLPSEGAGNGVVADPFEPVNRVVFQFNEVVDRAVTGPLARTYERVTPNFLETGIRNFLRNLRTPVILVNEVLQGDWDGAEVAATRLFVNSIAGLGGFVDIAGMDPELAFEPEDFGQTLARWGVGDGAYLVLPLLGPTTVRDLSGNVVDQAMDPAFWAAIESGNEELNYVRAGLEALDSRVRIEEVLQDIRENSLDPYATMRSLYMQSRQRAITEDDAESNPNLPNANDFNFEDTP